MWMRNEIKGRRREENERRPINSDAWLTIQRASNAMNRLLFVRRFVYWDAADALEPSTA